MIHVVTTGLQRLNKQGVKAWNAFIWLRLGTSGVGGANYRKYLTGPLDLRSYAGPSV